MINLNNKNICENCFAEISSEPCPFCGYSKAAAAELPNIMNPGTILLGKYIVGKTIGVGGFGITYLGYDAVNAKKIAIKEFFPQSVVCRDNDSVTVRLSSADSADYFENGKQKFYDEAKLVSRFNGNPNIVSVYEFFYENNTAYFAMEYLEGRDLKHYIQDGGGRISEGEMLTILNEITTALMAAHSANVLHRDISPDNIYICDDRTIKLIDFGAARQYSSEQSKSMSVILKQGFAPLEQYQKRGKQGPWTDIYALGATAYYALTGVILDDPISRLENDSLSTAAELGINENFYTIITKCIKLQIAERYSNIFELKNDLNALKIEPLPLVITQNENKPTNSVPISAAPAETMVTRLQTAAQPSIVPVESAGDNQKPSSKSRKKAVIIGASTVTVAAAVIIGAVAITSNKGNDVPVMDGGEQDTLISQEVSVSSQPEAGLPSVTTPQPEETIHPETMPEPVETQPSEIMPQPVETQPSETMPQPVETKPPVTTPQSVETTPPETMPQPVETQPAVTSTTSTTPAPVTEAPAEEPTAEELEEKANNYYNNGEYKKAMKYYKQAAELGSGNAMDAIGLMYRDGVGISLDYNQAFSWFNKAYKAGNISGTHNLGYCYYHGLGVDVDYDKAMELFKIAADGKSIYAYGALGECYYNGTGVAQNYTTAFKWLKKAFDGGNYYTGEYLGNCYLDGLGTAVDYERAIEVYSICIPVLNEPANAMCNLGWCYDQLNDADNAFKWYKKSADAGCVTAMTNTGICYYDGYGTASDHEKAEYYLKLAAGYGDANAQQCLDELF